MPWSEGRVFVQAIVDVSSEGVHLYRLLYGQLGFVAAVCSFRVLPPPSSPAQAVACGAGVGLVWLVIFFLGAGCFQCKGPTHSHATRRATHS